MGSNAPSEQAAPGGWASLLRPALLATVWVPIVLIGALHYLSDESLHWVHDILRRLYYLPIVLAAFQAGLRGGLVAAVLTSLSYGPHAFELMAHIHHDPAPGIEKVLEIALYHVVGGVAGYLADEEAQRKRQLLRALAEQRSLTQQLVRAGRLSALGEVVAGIAHEIKNPLHALAGTAEIVAPLIPADAEERPMWELHVSEIARLRTVAERFLSFARPHPLDLGPLDLRSVAERLRELVDAQARRQQVTLELDLPKEEVRVRGDRDQLAQVGINVAVNALRALEPQGTGRLRLRVGREERGERSLAWLELTNDGPRIPEDELERLFDPFHGSDERGTGLGLAISERIAEQHDGWLEARNGGLGVAFTLYLPAA